MMTREHNGDFRLCLPLRRSWGFVTVKSGQPEQQVLTTPPHWQPGYPIPEGLYILGSLDLACQPSAEGKLLAHSDFPRKGLGPFFRDLIPTFPHNTNDYKFTLRYLLPDQALRSDIYLVNPSDLQRIYEWSLRTPLSLLAVDYQLGSEAAWEALVEQPHHRGSPSLAMLSLLTNTPSFLVKG